jgi:hypothetical protein
MEQGLYGTLVLYVWSNTAACENYRGRQWTRLAIRDDWDLPDSILSF